MYIFALILTKRMMRKNLLFLVLLLTVSSAHATNLSFITGTWNRGTEREVTLYSIVLGRTERVAACPLTDDRTFRFSFEPVHEGFYVMGTGTPKSDQDKYLFYFQPGDSLSLAVNDSTYVLTGDNTVENQMLTRWHDEVLPLEWKSVYFRTKYGRVDGLPSIYIDFFPLLEQKAALTEAYVTGNETFDRLFARFRTYDLTRYAWTLLATPRMSHPTTKDYPEFLRTHRLEDITYDTGLMHYPFGSSLLQRGAYLRESSLRKTVAEQPQTPDDEWSEYNHELGKKVLEAVKNDTLKGELIFAVAEKLKTIDEYFVLITRYSEYVVTDDQKQRIGDLMKAVVQAPVTMETIDFSGTDIDDFVYHLNDFPGKVVLVDVWATWCVPCRREIPALQRLIEKYRDQDVVFMSISLDEVKDRQKWKNFVKKEALNGLQLFGGNGFRSEVAQAYQIRSIPHFLLFDKKGQLVTANAPRPSSPTLTKMLDDLLKK